MKDNEIVIAGEDGKEETRSILFTYEDEKTAKMYVFVNARDSEDEYEVYRYEEKDGYLYDVTDDAEFHKLEKVFQAYLRDEEEKRGK